MVTIELKVNGQLVRSVEVRNLGILDGMEEYRLNGEGRVRTRWKTRPATADDDPDGERLYGFTNSIGEQGYVLHARGERIEVLAARVLEGWT